MRETLLRLCVASLALSSLTYLADAIQMQVMSAPNVLRVGSPENVFVECQDCTGGEQVITISVRDYPAKTRQLTSTEVTLNSDFQGMGKITIPSTEFKKNPDLKQYVYLEAQFPGRQLEKVVMVSFQSGYIFIQTDKTIYTPNSKVNFRMFAVNPGMVPIERDANANQTDSISIEIVTPDDIILPVEAAVGLKSGLHSGTYDLPEIASFGTWKVRVSFQDNPQETFSSDFEVKEYVLPSFEVKLTPGSSFFYVDSEQLTIDILAKYLFGKEVDGTAYVVFGVTQNEKKMSFPSSLQRVPVSKGKATATLLKRHITEAFPDIKQLVKGHIFVSVSVLTESGGEMVEAQLRGIQIVTSPYTIHFKKTPKYFKSGISFDVSVVVTNPDDSPAVDVPVVVTAGNGMAVDGVTAGNGMAKVTVNTVDGAAYLDIHAKTADRNILDDSQQASADHRALPYTSRSNNYLHIGIDSSELKLGDNMKINLNLPRHAAPNQDITYLILSRGQLVKNQRFKRQGQGLVTVHLPVTKDMLPSFRIIAYYHIDTNEVVSDSVWVDVKDTCMGSLKLEPGIPATSYEPRKKFVLKITGDPGATVGLVAVDKGIYVLNNQHRLTQKKVWDLVEKYDTGCTAGGGKDSMGVFYDAGLLFVTNAEDGTPYRKELKCPVAVARRKRATTITDLRRTLAGRYTDNKQDYRCCVDGMKDTPLSYDCQRRSEYISDGAACAEAFLHCCTELANQRAENKEDQLHLARSEEDDDRYQSSTDDRYQSSTEIVSRTNFPESWLWKDIPLPKCDRNQPNCETTSVLRTEPLTDSITTWIITGISLSKTHGICVADSLDVVVHKPFFIDLRLPYTAVRGEQLEVKAILHNNSPNTIKVRVELMEVSDHLCSAASKRGKYRQEMELGPYTTRSVPFIIIPMKDGSHPIEVKASVQDSFNSDGVRKLLRVVPEGELIKEAKQVFLDPTKHEGKQKEVVNSGIPKSDVVPNAPTSTQISLIGGPQMSVFVENAISGNSMGSLIQQPWGCGEQNMITITSPVIATRYLDKTNKWEEVGIDNRKVAIQYISKGYTNQLSYRKDGCFAVFARYSCSTWLTAYVVKVFAMAYHLQVAVQESVICDAVKWLILNTQQPDGLFKEIGYVVHYGMRGDVHGTDSDASMTAFVLIAMQESRSVCDRQVNSMGGSIDKAVAYLEKIMPSLTNPYAVAMTSYALANEGKFSEERKLFLYTLVSSAEPNHWPVTRGHIYSLEATAYALLALVKAQAFDDAGPIVKWFNKQKKSGGGYGSTQATMIVYQAVAEYWENANDVVMDLDVDIMVPGRANPDSYNFNRDNFFQTRTSKLKDVNHDLEVTATGRGEATLTVVSLYYALPKEKTSDCQKFDVTVELMQVITEGEQAVKTYKLKILVLFKDSKVDSGMAILDIGLLTGFTVNTRDLALLTDGVDRVISKYEMDKALSERGSLIIYLDKVSHTKPDEIVFRVTQTMPVGIMQPAAVSVYEYYDQKKCVKFYHPAREHGELLTLCKKNAAECTCAEESCSMQKKDKVDNNEREAKACETAVDSKIDYVYKVRVAQFEDAKSTDIYHMRIESVIKQGTDMAAQPGQLRAFLSFQHCRESLGLTKEKTYLVMGTSKDMYRNDNDDPGYQYVMGERTWIEYWPTELECQSDEHRPVCLGLEGLVDALTIIGCPQ